MTRHREAPDDETFEDFLWEVDVTRRRPAAEHPDTAMNTAPASSAAPARPTYCSTQPRPGAFRTRSRLSGRVLARLGGGILLVGGTAVLVAAALMR